MSPDLPPARRLLVYGLAALLPFAFPLALPGFTSKPLPDGGQSFSLPLETLLILASLSFLPTALLMMTSFTRIVIVLSFLRQALGTQSAPPTRPWSAWRFC